MRCGLLLHMSYVAWSVSVSLSVGHTGRPCKTAELIEMSSGERNIAISLSVCLFVCLSFKHITKIRCTIHTHPFNRPLSGTTRVSEYQKGKTNPDFTETRNSEWQWHQLGYMQVCTSLQTDNDASTTQFLPRDAMHPRYLPWACVRLCLCLSVCHKPVFY